MANRFPCIIQRRCCDDGAEIPPKDGFLAIFLKEGEEHEQAVPEDWREELLSDNFFCNDRLLYIGRSGKLETRFEQHFTRSSSSTFRHSIGAMLCVNQKLSANVPTKNSPCSYDKALASDWIRKHCTFAYCEHGLEEKEAKKKKEELIKEYTPPFNIGYNEESCHSKLRKVRSKCLAKARK